MGIKITATCTKKNDPSFPCLMINPKTGLVILATEKRCDYGGVYYGTCLVSGREHVSVGEHTTTWSTDCFEVYDGQLTLTNK